MKIKAFFIVAFTLSAGALAQSPDPLKEPECRNQQQCEAMWVEAGNTINMVTQMRTRFATDMRIETFGPTGYGSMGGVVTKTPVSPGVYRISLRLECYRSTNCDDVRRSGTNFFNLMVTGAGIRFEN